jgi:hypothetical protein
MGDARRADRAGHRDVVVAAAPWELHAFFMPAMMCPCLVAWHGQHTPRRLRRSSARSPWLLCNCERDDVHPRRCASWRQEAVEVRVGRIVLEMRRTLKNCAVTEWGVVAHQHGVQVERSIDLLTLPTHSPTPPTHSPTHSPTFHSHSTNLQLPP